MNVASVSRIGATIEDLESVETGLIVSPNGEAVSCRDAGRRSPTVNVLPVEVDKLIRDVASSIYAEAARDRKYRRTRRRA